MKLLMKRDTVAGGRFAKKGQAVDVSEKEAKFLIAAKIAEKIETASDDEAQEMVESGEAEVPAEAVEATDETEEKPKKKGGKK